MRPSRKFLRLLTLLSFGCGVAFVGLALHLVLVTKFADCAAALAALGSSVVLLSVLGFVGAGRDKKSRLLLLCFFVNFVLVTGLLVSCYAAFFFQEILASWVKRHWTADVLETLRNSACCTTYSDMLEYLKHRMMIVGSVGIVCLVLVIASMYCIIHIVTVPIVMRSMLSVTNAVLMLLGTGLFVFGLSGQVHDEMMSGPKWMAIVFTVVGTLMVALAVLGIIGSKAKSRSLLLMYLSGLGCCFMALMVCSISAFSFSDNLASTYKTHTSSTLACDLNLPGCTNCTDVVSEMTRCKGVMHTHDKDWVSCTSGANGSTDSNCSEDKTKLNAKDNQDHEPNNCGKCPEWSASDVQAYLQSTLHLLGLFALIGCLFVIVGFASALILRRSLAGYQTDSI